MAADTGGADRRRRFAVFHRSTTAIEWTNLSRFRGPISYVATCCQMKCPHDFVDSAVVQMFSSFY
jgi:hypothetical protein